MTVKDLVREFTAQAEACQALAATLAPHSPERIEATARANTWRQAADRLKASGVK